MKKSQSSSFGEGSLFLCFLAAQTAAALVLPVVLQGDTTVQQADMAVEVAEEAALTHKVRPLEDLFASAAPATRQVAVQNDESRRHRRMRRDKKRALVRARLAPLLNNARPDRFTSLFDTPSSRDLRTALQDAQLQADQTAFVGGTLTFTKGSNALPGGLRFVEPELGLERPAERDMRAVRSCEPIVLQFSSDAPVAFHRSRVAFDLGQEEGEFTDWPEPETPWLALDRDGDGAITTGEELFGDTTVLASGGTASQGFEALAELDSNGDGAITPDDERFSELLLWSDSDRDRVSASGELGTLAEYGVVHIDLAWSNGSRCDARGNCESERAMFVWRDSEGVEQRGEAIDVDVVARLAPKLASTAIRSGP